MTRLALILLVLLRSALPAGAELPSEPILRLEPGMHGARIWRIDVDAKERFLVTGSDDKTVRVWALAEGRPLATLRLPIGEGHVGEVFAVAISPDGERIAAGGWGPEAGLNSIYVFERASGRIVQRIDGLPNAIVHLAFSPDGRHLVACLGANGIRVYETVSFAEVAADRDYGGYSLGAAFDREGRLVTSSYDGHIRLYDADFRLIGSKKAPGGELPVGVAFSSDGAQVALGYDDSTRVDVLDGRTLAPLFEADTHGVTWDLSKVAWSQDGAFLYAAGRNNAPGQHPVRRWAEGGQAAYEDIALSQNTIMDLAPLADGGLAFGTQDPTVGILGAGGHVLWRQNPAQANFRDQDGRVAVSGNGAHIVFGFEQFGNSAAAFELATRRLTLDPEPGPGLVSARTTVDGLDIENWKSAYGPTVNGKRLPLEQYEMSRSLAIAPDSERFLLGTEWYLRLFGGEGAELWQRAAPGTAWAVNITGDGRLAIAAFGDGTIRWFRLEDGEELLAFFPHPDRERWVVWTPQGYYMASPGGETLIGWHVNRGLDTPEFYTAGRFRDRFHRPDVIALVLEELDVGKALTRADAAAGTAVVTTPKAAKADLAASLPPAIEIIDPAQGASYSSDFLAVTYLLRAHGNVPPKVSAQLNGQLLKAETLGEPISGDYYDQISIPLRDRISSSEFTVSLIAQDDFGASDPASVTLRWGGATRDQEKVRLLVLAVGVSDYAHDPPRDLDYAAKDASDLVGELLRQKERGLYRDVKVRLLTDKEASKIDILDGLKWLYDEARSGDVAIVYFAGHGRDEPMGGGLVFHYLPHEVDVGSTARRQATALSKDVLLDELTAIYQKGTKVLTFLDTCYAGAVGGNTRDLAADIDLFAAELASAENGVVVFTSSKATQVAKEDSSWENGAFTEALLELLAGKATTPGHNYVSISDLKRYLRQRVQELTGGQQTPEVYNETKLEIDAPIFMIR